MNEQDRKFTEVDQFFLNYGVKVKCVDYIEVMNSCTYILDLMNKTRVKDIKLLIDEIKLFFNCVEVQFEIAINGTSYLGMRLIKEINSTLLLEQLINSEEFQNINFKLPFIVGKNYNGKVIVEDLAELPHLLVSGTTGTGKSVFLNTLIIELLVKLKENFKLVLIDTRGLSFINFSNVKNLLIPIITDSKRACGMLEWLVQEMTSRYKTLAQNNIDNIDHYNLNAKIKIPRIIVIIDDFADLMIEAGKDVEASIIRLSQMSRAAGIHLVISTQRPSTDVLTGIIKANLPSRLAFKVPSQIDSKTILDCSGAESLLIYGDAIFKKVGEINNERVQTPFISDIDIKKKIESLDVISNETNYLIKEEESIEIISDEDNTDSLLDEAIQVVVESQIASTSFIQRKFKIGYERAAKIIDQMEERGVISGYQGSKSRDVLISKARLEEMKK